MYRQPAAPPKTRLPLLDRVAIKTPCRASWNDMEGDDRVRFCCSCSKSVYDLSAMTEDEAEAFLAFHLDDEDACVRLYRRPDGRILTSDCPRGAGTRHARRAAMAVTAAVCAATAVAAAVGNAHVPRAHGLPRSTARFEVPRAAAPPPRTTSMLDGEVVAAPAREEPPESGFALGGMAIIEHPATTGPKIRIGADMAVSAGLPREVVSRITRQNFGRFRVAYERGLKANPSLAGRVVVRFTIGRDGDVTEAGDDGSSIADASVVHDVVQSFTSLAFPQPEGGRVTVTMSLDFSPS